MTGNSRSRPAAVIVVAVIVVACTAATPKPSEAPTAAAQTQMPVTASPATSVAPSPSADGHSGALIAEADGLSLTVTLDRTTIAPGEVATFTATFHNGGTDPIDYAVPWCGGAASARVSVGLPQEPVGKRWSGIAQVFKDYVLTEAYGPGGVPALKPVAIDVLARPCEDGQFEDLLAPGESITTSMPWMAEIVADVAALAGTVPFTVSVGYDRQNGPPSYPPDYTGPPGSWSPIYKQLVVTGALEIVGEARPLAGPGELIDSILANRKFANWLTQQPRETWSNANLFLTSSPNGEGIIPAGPSWELDLFREMGVPRNWMIAFIDPFDASVRSVTYCDIPCDR
jgi:hypothetical protein